MRQETPTGESTSGNLQKPKESGSYSHRITNYFCFCLKPKSRFVAPSLGESFPGVLLQKQPKARGADSVKQIKYPLITVFLLFGFFLLYSEQRHKPSPGDAAVDRNAVNVANQGRDIFRNDTFGDEDFWGGT